MKDMSIGVICLANALILGLVSLGLLITEKSEPKIHCNHPRHLIIKFSDNRNDSKFKEPYFLDVKDAFSVEFIIDSIGESSVKIQSIDEEHYYDKNGYFIKQK